ncbi:hypothetical protein ACMFMG_003982 [Clarireedia jacksonii]
MFEVHANLHAYDISQNSMYPAPQPCKNRFAENPLPKSAARNRFDGRVYTTQHRVAPSTYVIRITEATDSDKGECVDMAMSPTTISSRHLIVLVRVFPRIGLVVRL